MKAERRRLFALVALTIGSGAAILDGTVVTLALPHITEQLSEQQWITNAYLLSLSSLILIGGSLGDIIGRKRVYLVGLMGFGLTSALCGFAQSVDMLILFRILQGVFGALMVPGALSIINGTFPKHERPQAIGRWTAWSSIAVIAGPFLGGLILAVADWRWIFFVNIPLVLACFLLGRVYIEESKDDRPRKVDGIGAALVFFALSLLTYSFIEGPKNHWNALTFGLLAIAFLAFIGFIMWERRTKDPMVKLSLFKSRNFSGSNIMTFLMYGALGGMSFALMIYLQEKLHFEALAAGLTMLPVSIMMMLFSGKVGALSSKFGTRIFMTIGPIVCGAGIGWLYFLQPGSSLAVGVLPGTILFGIGLTLMVAPLTATVMGSVVDRDSGIASGINNAVARSAGLIVVALLGFFGGAHSYQFGMALCAVLAISSGVISYAVIRPDKLTKDLI